MKGSPLKSERQTSPLRRKKSVARTSSPRKSAGVKDADAEPLRSLSQQLDSSRRPPRAPPTHEAATTLSSPADSIEPTPRPGSPVTALTSRKDKDGKDKLRVRVFVRMRPLHESEGESTMRQDGTGQRLWLAGERAVGNEAGLPLQFEFDGVLPSDVMQHDVYETVARPLVEAATAGYSACLMCYGQTGTGKTFTFGGGDCLKAPPPPPASGSSSNGSGCSSSSSPLSSKGSSSRGGKAQPTGGCGGRKGKDPVKLVRSQLREAQHSHHGVVGRALRHVMDWAEPRSHRVSFAYVQVYMELLQDLLRPESNLTLREHPELGVYVDGAMWKTITSAEAACAEVAKADIGRATAFTKLNADSSRSHAVLLIAIRGPEGTTEVRPTSRGGAAGSDSDVMWASAQGRLFLVDLAGSERTKRSGVVGLSFDEACSINQSLTTLGRCIGALASAKSGGGATAKMRAPVRESKLTRLLSPCLMGSTTTSLVCCVSGAAADRVETQSTLEFGRNAMRVLLKPQSTLGVDYKSLTIELQAQLDVRQQPIYEVTTLPPRPTHKALRNPRGALHSPRRATVHASSPPSPPAPVPAADRGERRGTGASRVR